MTKIAFLYCFLSSWFECDANFFLNGCLYFAVVSIISYFLSDSFIKLSNFIMIIHLYHILVLNYVLEPPDIYDDFIHQYPQILFYDKSLLNFSYYNFDYYLAQIMYPLVVSLLCCITMAFYLVNK